MGSLKQQINLYHPKRRVLGLNLVTLLIGLGVGLFVIAVAAVSVEFQISSAQDQVAQNQKILEQLRNQLALQKVKLGIKEDPKLLAELKRLRKDRRTFDAMARLVEKQKSMGVGGYSAYMRGLARHPVRGLWLEHLYVSSGDKAVVIRGGAERAALVPVLLDGLSDEDAYKGLTFADVLLQRAEDEQNGVLQFELRSRGAVGGKDAG